MIDASNIQAHWLIIFSADVYHGIVKSLIYIFNARLIDPRVIVAAVIWIYRLAQSYISVALPHYLRVLRC